MPQSLQFDLASPHEFAALVEFVNRLQPSLVEVLDPASSPVSTPRRVVRSTVPYDIFIADAGLLGQPAAQPLASLLGLHRPLPAARRSPTAQGTRANHWSEIAGGARRILAPCREAEAFAKRILPRHKIELIAPVAEEQSSEKPKRRQSGTRRLGFVPIRCGAQEQDLMGAIAQNFIGVRPEVSFTVIGSTLDDLALMRRGHVFVTGAVDVEEFDDTVKAYGIDYLFFCTTRPLFGHPIQQAARSSFLPTAAFDWSMGRVKPKSNNLAIDPGSSLDELVAVLSRWMAKR